MIVELFAGPGGWCEGLKIIGRSDVIGVEWDKAACQTARAAGHRRIRADVATLDPATLARRAGTVEGLIASPPCQAWSMAGKRAGELDRANCHRLADRMAEGDDTTTWTRWEDHRSPLVCQPVRWARDLQPDWIALEEVPAVASLWNHFARILDLWGYHVWTGDLCAADYGVPQTRTRRILLAHRTRSVGPPPPTHARHAHGGDLFGGETLPWVSMADALGWGFDTEPSATVSGGGGGGGGAEPFANHAYRQRLADHVRTRGASESGGNEFPVDQPSWAVTSKARSWVVDRRTKTGGQWVVRPDETPPVYVNGNQPNAGRRSADEPAPTVLFGHRANDVRWVYERPATTVAGDPRVAPPGHRDRAGGERQHTESIRVTVRDAAILQSFRADFPWHGTRTKQFEQIGNAVPPRLAALGIGELPANLKEGNR